MFLIAEEASNRAPQSFAAANVLRSRAAPACSQYPICMLPHVPVDTVAPRAVFLRVGSPCKVYAQDASQAYKMPQSLPHDPSLPAHPTIIIKRMRQAHRALPKISAAPGMPLPLATPAPWTHTNSGALLCGRCASGERKFNCTPGALTHRLQYY